MILNEINACRLTPISIWCAATARSHHIITKHLQEDFQRTIDNVHECRLLQVWDLNFEKFYVQHPVELYGIIIIIIDIQPLGRSGQRPELSQATGMALVRASWASS